MLKLLFLVLLCGHKVDLSEMDMENTPEPHNFVTIHDWDFSMGGRIQIDNSSDQESTISGSPTENITGNYRNLFYYRELKPRLSRIDHPF